MHFPQQIKKVMNIFLLLFPLVFSVGFLASLYHIHVNQYMTYKMVRLITFTFQKSINHGTVLLSIFCIILFLIIFVRKHIERIIPSNIIEIRIKDKNTAVKIVATLICCLFFFIYIGRAINHYWLPGRFQHKSLFVNIVIIIFTIFLGWIFIKIKWERLFIASRRKYIKRLGVLLIILLVLLNFVIFITSKINIPKHPNILFIAIDTLRADHLSCYGYKKDTSPNIDKLSLNSIMFKNAISPAPWTTPSIGSIFSSQYPAVLGFLGNSPVKINDEFLTLAEVLRENKYKTKGIISHAFLSSKLGFNQGFNSYDEGNAKGHGHISAPSLVEKAVSFLKNNKNNNFFLFVHFFDPHFDFILHEKFNYFPDYDGSFYSSQPIHELREYAPYMQENDVNYIKSLYDSEISFTDEHIGKLLDKLKELGLFDNTLIVLTADHGEEFLERGDYWIGHTKKLYQEQIHVPLIIKLPGNNERKIIEEYIGLIDLMPTIIDLVDLEIPNKYEHKGKTANLNGEERLESRPIISETSRNVKLQSVVWKEWKFIYNSTMNIKELYNLTRDPMETENVALINGKILSEMETILQKWSNYTHLKSLGIKYQKPDFKEEQIERLKSLGYIK